MTALAMKKEELREMINTLLGEIEEEDVGISLFSTFYQSEADLRFFTEEDRARVLKILKKLSDDSIQHKIMLEKIINALEKKLHAK